MFIADLEQSVTDSSILILNFEQVSYVLVIPVVTGRKLNVHKTFRKRPGRLLNVLCTFNLHTVSAG